MKLSKRQRAFVAILALALGALIVDRAFLGSGSPVPDEAVAGSSPAAAPPPSAPPRPPAGDAAGKPALADRLAELARAHELKTDEIRDAFRLSPAWLAECSPQPTGEPEPTPADRFAQAHRLTGVVVKGQAGIVLVDGGCVAIGQVLDGFRLVSVADNSAVFEANGQRVVLKLNEKP